MAGIFAGAALVAIVAGIFLFTIDTGGGVAVETTPTETEPQPEPELDADKEQAEAALRELIEKKVGGFTLVDDSVVREDALLQKGANAALSMDYEAGDGVTLIHFLIAWPSKSSAENYLAERVKHPIEDGTITQTETADVKTSEGEIVGTVHVLQSENYQDVLWSNGKPRGGGYSCAETTSSGFLQ